MDEIEVYRGRWGKWRWRYKAAGNHEKLANGNEGYRNLSDLFDSMARVTGLYRDEIGDYRHEQTLRRPGTDDLIKVVIQHGE